jgi:hypothetical protein
MSASIEACGVTCVLRGPDDYFGHGASRLDVRVYRYGAAWHCVVSRCEHAIAVGCGVERDDAIEACVMHMAFLGDALRQMHAAHCSGSNLNQSTEA